MRLNKDGKGLVSYSFDAQELQRKSKQKRKDSLKLSALSADTKQIVKQQSVPSFSGEFIIQPGDFTEYEQESQHGVSVDLRTLEEDRPHLQVNIDVHTLRKLLQQAETKGQASLKIKKLWKTSHNLTAQFCKTDETPLRTDEKGNKESAEKPIKRKNIIGKPQTSIKRKEEQITIERSKSGKKDEKRKSKSNKKEKSPPFKPSSPSKTYLGQSKANLLRFKPLHPANKSPDLKTGRFKSKSSSRSPQPAPKQSKSKEKPKLEKKQGNSSKATFSKSFIKPFFNNSNSSIKRKKQKAAEEISFSNETLNAASKKQTRKNRN